MSPQEPFILQLSDLFRLTDQMRRENLYVPGEKQVSFKKEVGVMVNDLVFWLIVCLILKMCY